MPDTGAPWNIPYVEPSDLVRDYPDASEDLADAIAAGLSAAGGFDELEVITVSTGSWSVPTLADPVVKITVIGGGGGGGGGSLAGGSGFVTGGVGGTGGTTEFAFGETFQTDATGGAGGAPGGKDGAGTAGTAGFSAGNGGQGGGLFNSSGATKEQGQSGNGGSVVVAYVDLTGATSLDLRIGAGGAAGTAQGAGAQAGGAGGRGEIIVEYKAG